MGKRRRKKKSPRVASPGGYPLKQVRQLKHQGKFLIRSNAFQDAWKDFGWKKKDIVDALNKLQRKHYHKTDLSKFTPPVTMDFYQALGLKGENVYTHFYVHPKSGNLVISSFKRIRGKR